MLSLWLELKFHFSQWTSSLFGPKQDRMRAAKNYFSFAVRETEKCLRMFTQQMLKFSSETKKKKKKKRTNTPMVVSSFDCTVDTLRGHGGSSLLFYFMFQVCMYHLVLGVYQEQELDQELYQELDFFQVTV